MTKVNNLTLNSKNTVTLILMSAYLFLATFSPKVFSIDESYITPTYVRIITSPYDQYNDINPSWSGNSKYISFERYDSKSHEIIVSDKTGNRIQSITVKKNDVSELDTLFSTEEDGISYNTGISWSAGNREFVFISSGKSNNFDLFLGKIGTRKTRQLTFHPLKDSQANWSPTNNNIVFVSARKGHAGLFMLDANSGNIVQLLGQQHNALHPVWSPDGKQIAVMIKGNNQYQVYVINDVENPESSLKKISEKSQQSIRPSWSPDGSKVAYFSLTKNNTWDINIANITRPSQHQKIKNPVAKNVIQNSHKGPTWLPDSKSIAYVKNTTDTYNPIYIVDPILKKHSLFLTNTAMNLDLSCSKNGDLAFQTQDRQWTRIYIAGIPGFEG